ncbi:putative uncharacterized protein C7orf78 homolog [Calonectris borealis]|uniref:putative uncharacterized protein C7orf78 homolog n=1 Tax=Calonectris borealis TaxID=1323832 RepID=UPI003F4C8825
MAWEQKSLKRTAQKCDRPKPVCGNLLYLQQAAYPTPRSETEFCGITISEKKKTSSGRYVHPPPSYQLYRTSNPSQKLRGKEKGELKPKITSESIVMQELSRLRSRLLLPLSEKKRDLPQLVTHLPRISSYEAKIPFVKNGKYKTGVYEDSKPHDYSRHDCLSDVTMYFPFQVQYEANLPNLVTSYSRNPLNLKLKSQHLNTDPGLEPLKGKQKDSDRRLLTHKSFESKWDPRLLLPKNPWPPKSASFTIKAQRRRGAHTAFLDRVEEKLCRLQQGETGRDESQPKQHSAEKKSNVIGTLLSTIIHTNIPNFCSQEMCSSARAMEDTSGPELCLVYIL